MGSECTTAPSRRARDAQDGGGSNADVQFGIAEMVKMGRNRTGSQGKGASGLPSTTSVSIRRKHALETEAGQARRSKKRRQSLVDAAVPPRIKRETQPEQSRTAIPERKKEGRAADRFAPIRGQAVATEDDVATQLPAEQQRPAAGPPPGVNDDAGLGLTPRRPLVADDVSILPSAPFPSAPSNASFDLEIASTPLSTSSPASTSLLPSTTSSDTALDIETTEIDGSRCETSSAPARNLEEALAHQKSILPPAPTQLADAAAQSLSSTPCQALDVRTHESARKNDTLPAKKDLDPALLSKAGWVVPERDLKVRANGRPPVWAVVSCLPRCFDLRR